MSVWTMSFSVSLPTVIFSFFVLIQSPRHMQQLMSPECCVKVNFVQELEDTISSLRQQVSVLQQRATLLQEDLESTRLTQSHTQTSSWLCDFQLYWWLYMMHHKNSFQCKLWYFNTSHICVYECFGSLLDRCVCCSCILPQFWTTLVWQQLFSVFLCQTSVQSSICPL